MTNEKQSGKRDGQKYSKLRVNKKKEVNGKDSLSLSLSESGGVLRWISLFLIWSLNRVSKLSAVTTNS